MPLPIADIWVPTTQELSLFGPELGLVGTIVAVLVVTMITGRNAQVTAGVALLGILGTLLLTGWSAGRVVFGGLAGMAPPDAPPMLVLDNFSVFFKLFITLFLALITWLWLIGIAWRQELPGRRRSVLESPPEFFVLLLTSALGMCLMVGTLNLLLILVAIETASLPSYAIVASDKRSRVGAEASIKYVLFGATTAAVMIYGISLLYGVFHTLDLPTIATKVAADPGAVSALGWLGLLGLGVGIAFKISAVPLHFWCPDVFEGAPIEVTTWLSVASKAAGLGLLLRIVHAFIALPAAAGQMLPLAYAVGAVAAITCTVGNLAALRQTSVKRMLAYSSIAHAGYMMMAAAIFVVPRPHSAASAPTAALIAYVFVYLLMNLGAFGVTAMVSWKTGNDQISSFTGLGRRAPWLALPMAVCLFSLIGLPPLGGFAAKWWLLWALGEAAKGAQAWLWILILVAVINTALSLYYYVGVIRHMYLADDPQQESFAAPLGGLAMVNACAILLILLGTVFFNPLGDRAKAFASNLFTPVGGQIMHRPDQAGIGATAGMERTQPSTLTAVQR
jgi:NADH-quinone oxidoreductase subunit N